LTYFRQLRKLDPIIVLDFTLILGLLISFGFFLYIIYKVYR